MKHTAHKLLALLLVLAMLLSVFAVAEDGAQAIVGAEGPIELGGEAVDEGQDPMDGLEIATEGDGITEGVLELEDGADLDMNIELGADLELELDLEGDTLETLEGELAPVTEEAMNAGESWDTFDFDAPPVGAGNYEIPVDGGPLLLPVWDVPTDGVTKLKLSGDFDLGAGRIVVGNGATLEIFGESNKSIRGYGSHLILVAGGTLKLHGGTVTGQSPYGVFVGQGTFTMDGGEISVTYDGGIGVYNQATFTMEKGKISAEGDGAAGVNNSIVGTFEMNGNAGTCTVSAKGLGAVGVDNDANCTFTMKGGSVTATGDNSQSVLNNGTFTMGAGSEIGGEFVGVTNNSGTFTMNGGEISMPAGASIAVENSGTFTMNGGEISMSDNAYRAVKNSGTFNMTGGTISAGDKLATGVYNEDKFTMTGGTISGFDHGVSNCSPGTFIMEKDPSDSSTGTISGNNWGVSNNTPFTMKDGRITGNTVYGVRVSSGSFEMFGGAITGNGKYGVDQGDPVVPIQLSGKVDISGNTTADVNLQYSGGVIAVGENFSCDKPIGVSRENAMSLPNSVITKDFAKNMGSKDPAKFFVSKENGYGLFWNSGKTEVEFGAGVTCTFDPNGGTGTMDPWIAPKGKKRGVPMPECEFTNRGHTFYAWLYDHDGDTIVEPGGDVFFGEDTVFHALWNQNEVEVSDPEDQAYTGKAVEPKLTVTDKVTKEKLVAGTDYTVAYSNNVKATDYAVATVTFKGDYKDCGEVNRYFAITPKSLTVTAEDKTKVYGEKDPALTYKVEGLLDGDKLEGSLTRAAGDEVGEYAITQGTLKNDNYTITFTGAKLTITKADPAVTAPTAKTGLVETGSAQALVEEGKAEGGTMQYSLDGKTFSAKIPTGTDAGDYTVYYKVVGDKNHNDTEAKTVKVTIEAKASEPTTAPSAAPTAAPTTAPTAAPSAPTAAPTPEPTPADPDYTLLARMTVSEGSKTALKLDWTKVKDADGYDVFFAECNKAYKLKKTVKATKPRAVLLKNLVKQKGYKACVRAWKRVDGQKVYIGKASPNVHAISGGYTARLCNARSVKLNKASLTLKAGKSAKLKATLKGVKAGRKLLEHVAEVRWYSTDTNVATVDANGKVKAVGKGSCTIYAIANNGVRKSAKVTVK